MSERLFIRLPHDGGDGEWKAGARSFPLLVEFAAVILRRVHSVQPWPDVLTRIC